MEKREKCMLTQKKDYRNFKLSSVCAIPEDVNYRSRFVKSKIKLCIE